MQLQSLPVIPLRLVRLRTKLGLTQAQLAAALGVSRVIVNRWERGQARPSMPALRRIGLLESEAGAPSHERMRALSTAAMRPRTNLPAPVTSFIGRERELDEVHRLLGATRLLTLTGAGGIGKTRLALEVGCRMSGVGSRDGGSRQRSSSTEPSETRNAANSGSAREADVLDPRPSTPEIRPADGVWLVELAALGEPGLFAPAVASALGVRERPGRPLIESLTTFLAPKRSLLLLDNCEHLIDACAALCETLLAGCPQLRILATSRAPLGIPGERTWRVPGLSLPDRGDRSQVTEDRGEGTGGGAGTQSSVLSPQSSPESSVLTPQSSSEAVRLFVERARARQPAFALTEMNVAAVVEICRRLDGSPLALELAATQMQTLSAQQLVQRLDARFRLLVGGRRTVPRQQSLRATMEWSYDLLEAAERRLFNWLAVFAGGFALEAVEALAADAGDGADAGEAPALLGRLVEHSLVLADEQDGAMRYRMLETIRAYAHERLVQSGEREQVRRRHALYYLTLAETAAVALEGPEQGVWLERLEREHDNLRAALRGFIEQAEAGLSLRLAGALWYFWELRGHWEEGSGWLERALTRRDAATPAIVAKALVALGVMERLRGRYAAAVVRFTESLVLRRALGDQAGIAESLRLQGDIDFHLGDYATARQRYAEGLAIRRQLGDRLAVAWSLQGLGDLSLREGDYAAARGAYGEALALRRELGGQAAIAWLDYELAHIARIGGDQAARTLLEKSRAQFHSLRDRRGEGLVLAEFGFLARGEGDADAARALLREGLALCWEIGERDGSAACLLGLAGLALARGQIRAALRLRVAVERLFDSAGARIYPPYRDEYDGIVTAICAALGEEAVAAAWAGVRAQPLDELIADVLAQARADSEAVPALPEAEVASVPPEPGTDESSHPIPAPGRLPRDGRLSAREAEVLRLLAGGRTNREIAAALVLSIPTVERHLTNLYAKIGVRGRAEAIVHALRQRDP